MQKLDAFKPRVLPWVVGCSEPLAEQMIVDAAIAFCEDTHYLQVTTDPQQLQPGVDQYDVDVPLGHDVCRILNVWYGDEHRPSGRPVAFDLVDPTTLSIYPVPGTGALLPMQMRLALKPSRGAKSLDDSMLRDWAEGIAAGAIQRICSIPGQSFSSDTDAMKAYSTYKYWVGKARFETTKKRRMVDLTVQMRPFA